MSDGGGGEGGLPHRPQVIAVVGSFPKIAAKARRGMAREMTDPSSLSARAPSIFVGANRPAESVCVITLR